MSAPAPRTENVPLENDALPARPVLPTSWFCHGAGRPLPDAPVVNVQIGPAVLPPLDTAVTRQK